MNREIIQPRDVAHWLEARSQDLTSTEIGALFDLSPWSTHLEVWHRHKNNSITQLEENERMKWGTRLEAAIAHGVLVDNKWDGRPMKEYIRIPEHRIGASFDWRVQVNVPRIIGGQDHIRDGDDDSHLEIKNVDSLIFKENWNLDGEDLEAPLHIEMQVQHQMLVSGLKKAVIAAFVGGNRTVLLHREADPNVHQRILEKAAAFWRSIDKNEPPAPDFTRDSAFITSLLSHAEPGKVFDARGNTRLAELARIFKEAHEAEKAASEIKDSVKAEVLTIIGDAEKVIGENFTSVDCGITGPAIIPEHTRAGFRRFRFYFKKEKKK